MVMLDTAKAAFSHNGGIWTDDFDETQLNDGILSPKPMAKPYDWEPMGDPEYRALYYTLCKFNQINRTNQEWKQWGKGPDEVINCKKVATSEYYLVTAYIFLDVFLKMCGPTARKIIRYQEADQTAWDKLIQRMTDIAGGISGSEHFRLSPKQFMAMMKYWRLEIGIPRDIHAAFADFLPRTANAFHLCNGAVRIEYEKRLLEFGGEPYGEGAVRISRPIPEEARGELLQHGLLFPGEGAHALGMVVGAAHLPQVREKLDIASSILGFDALELCSNGPPEKLTTVEYGSIVMYLAGCAAYDKLLHENSNLARRARAAAGFEAGEFVALTVSGVLPFEVGLQLVRARGKAMDELMSLWPEQRSCSLACLTEERIMQLCNMASTTVPLTFPANSRFVAGPPQPVCQVVTSLFPKGFIVGGHSKLVEKFHEFALAEKPLQAKLLAKKATHCAFMQPLQWIMKAKLREYSSSVQFPWCDVYFNANSDYRLLANGGGGNQSLEDVLLLLSKAVSETCYKALRWDSQVKSMIENGCSEFYELAPSSMLKPLMKRISKEAFDKTTHISI